MFRAAVVRQWGGLSYLIVKEGFPLVDAMQDAMDAHQFVQVLDLLDQIGDSEDLTQTNSAGLNLYHILAKNTQYTDENILEIYGILKERHVDPNAKCNKGRTCLHYVAAQHNTALLELFLEDFDMNVNKEDKEGQRPFGAAITGKKASYMKSINAEKNVLKILKENGARTDFHFKENAPRDPLETDNETDKEDLSDIEYTTTPLIHLVQSGCLTPSSSDASVIRTLMEMGSRVSEQDSFGIDPIMKAILQNDEAIVSMLLNHVLTDDVKTNQDQFGNSSMHYAVWTLPYGSFENVKILRLLIDNGFSHSIKDKAERTPLDLALMQESGKMAAVFRDMGIEMPTTSGFQRQLSVIPSSEWEDSHVDYESDSTHYLEKAKDRENSEKKGEELVPPDSTGQFPKGYKVYNHEEHGPMDAYMTKVDLKNGIYGDYLFYKIQLLHDTVKDLYVVFTRYGRIGEDGMSQRTPFAQIDEAMKEFTSIFKSKTGNVFGEEFVRVPKKYLQIKFNYKTVDFKDYLVPFSKLPEDTVPKSKLHPKVRDLMSAITDSTSIAKAMNHFGIDTGLLNPSNIDKPLIQKARDYLKQIGDSIQELDKIQQDAMTKSTNEFDYDLIGKEKDNIADLSSRFYELIPHHEYRNQIAPPVTNANQLKQKVDMLNDLGNIEMASKILLGALQKAPEMNPIDYCFSSLNMKVNPLGKDSDEFKLLKRYIYNTYPNRKGSNTEIKGIFDIQIKGEAESVAEHSNLKNHYLLYHGSKTFNFMGILGQGLRIAPPEAPTTGYMFGKGIYFADVFEKSLGYCYDYWSNDGEEQNQIMLMSTLR